MPVYLVRAGKSNAVKIGFARDIKSRLAKMQIDNHEHLTVIRAWVGGKQEERMLHQKFAGLRLRGEWFSFSGKMLGDVGLPVFVVPPDGPKLNKINPLTGKVGRAWTAEERAAAGARQRAITADPVRSAARREKLRATLKRKAAQRAAEQHRGTPS